MIDRIRNTGIFGYALVSEVDLSVLVNGNVFEEGVATDCIVDVRFRLLVEVDNLCVASALEVEHTFVVPAVLVVTDEQTLRVGGKGGLAGS